MRSSLSLTLVSSVFSCEVYCFGCTKWVGATVVRRLLLCFGLSCERPTFRLTFSSPLTQYVWNEKPITTPQRKEIDTKAGAFDPLTIRMLFAENRVAIAEAHHSVGKTETRKIHTTHSRHNKLHDPSYQASTWRSND